MRVAVLAHSFPRFPGDTHGPFVKDLCEALARRGHEVFVLVPFDRELRADPTTPLHISSFRYAWPDRLHILGYSRTLRRDVGMKLGALLLSPLYFWFAERALLRLVERERIELIHAHWLLPNGFVAYRVHRRTGVPFAATLHGSDVFMAEKSRLLGRMAARAAASSSYVTSCSADLRDRVLALGGVPADRVLLLPNGTHLPDLAARTSGLLARHGVDANDELVVAVGRLVDKKGFRYLIAAMPQILARAPRARLVLGGGGDLSASLEAQARELGVAARVTFTGMLSHPEVLELVANAAVFVMPSVRDEGGNIDGLPIVVLEAMAAGKPVVGTDLAGLPLAVIDGETGLLVAEKDSLALARAVVSLLADPVRAREMGARGRTRVERELNWEEIAARHDALLRAAVLAC